VLSLAPGGTVVTRENIDSEVVLTARLTAARSTDTSGFIIATLAVSASENSDFVPGPYPLTIPAGETEITQSIGILDDDYHESNEQFNALLWGFSLPSDVVLGTSETVITILDDDRPRVSFAAGSSSVAESGGTQNVAVSISPAPTTAITVNYTVSGSATENTDFSITGSGTVTVAANATSVNIPVLITDDNGEEAAETVILTLSSGVGYNVGSTSSHILTIADNDTPGLVLSPPSLTVTEGGTGSYTAALATPPSAPVTVNVFSDNGEVTFAPASLSFTTSNWSTAQPVTVTAAQDGDTANDNATLSHTASGGGYGSLTAEVAVTVTDDDTADDTDADDTDNDPPVVANAIGDQSARVGRPFSYTFPANIFSDPTNDPLSYSASQGDDSALPGWLSFAAGSLTFSGVPTAADVGVLTVKLSASDGVSTVYTTFSITVTANTLTISPSSLMVTEGQTGSYTVALSDSPSAPVTVDVVSDNDEVTVAPASLSFTVENWNTPQPVTVVTEQNNEMANDMATLTHTASGGGYGSVTGEVAVDVLDVANDLLFSQSLLTVMESQDVSYTVALSTQPSATVTVDVVSDNGGVTVAPASLSFTIENWNTPQSVRVTAAQDNGMANHSAMLHHRATGDGYTGVSGAVQVQVEAAESRAVAAWHVRFGRTVAQQVVDAVQQRLTTPPPLSGLQVTVAGENLTATPLEENEGALSKLLGFEAVTTGQVAQDSAFSFSPPAPAEDGEGDTPQLSFWGAGALSSFHGQEDTLSLDGNVGTALLGADWRTQQWQAGAALSHSWGSGSYAGEDGNDAALTARLTGLFPYGRYALSPRLGVWAVAGYGWGTLSVKPDGSKREYQPGATMVMGAVGLDGLLIDGGDDGFSLSTTTDLLTVKTTTEQVDGLASSEGSVSRLRMGLEATRPVPLPNGASLLPSVEVGIRHDGGDAETGFGLEVGAALAWHDPQRGISAEVKGRSLGTHVEEEFREQGMALSFSWNPDPSNRGPSLAIGHTVGDAASGMDALLDPTVLEGGGAAAGSNSHQFTADFAYGFPIHNDRLTLTPAVAVALSPESRSYGLLWSLAPYSQQGRTQPWQLSLEGEREENTTADTPVDHSLMLNFSLLF